MLFWNCCTADGTQYTIFNGEIDNVAKNNAITIKWSNKFEFDECSQRMNRKLLTIILVEEHFIHSNAFEKIDFFFYIENYRRTYVAYRDE